MSKQRQKEHSGLVGSVFAGSPLSFRQSDYHEKQNRLFVFQNSLSYLKCGAIINAISFQKGLKQYCFVVFLLECSLVAAFIFLVIPETKNKSFLEIKKEFHKLNFGRKSKEKETELNERSQLRGEHWSIFTAMTEWPSWELQMLPSKWVL